MINFKEILKSFMKMKFIIINLKNKNDKQNIIIN